MLVITEKEMIYRFVDGCRRAADRADQFLKADPKERPKIVVDFIEQIKVAAGSAHQLAHSREHPQWLQVRDFLEKIIETGKTLILMKDIHANSWVLIHRSLLDIASKGENMAFSRGPNRTETLAELNKRQLRLSKNV